MNATCFEIAVIKGDGIGIDVTDAALAVIDAARHRVGGFDLDCQDLRAGAGYFQETGRDMAPGAEEAAAAADAIFFWGPSGCPRCATRTAPKYRRICGCARFSSCMRACAR